MIEKGDLKRLWETYAVAWHRYIDLLYTSHIPPAELQTAKVEATTAYDTYHRAAMAVARLRKPGPP